MNAALTVHIVDDDALFRDGIARLLRASGYQVAAYESGQQFLKNSADIYPGCILLDMRLSDLDGFELQDRLKQTGCILPIVFLTGYGDIPTSVRAIKAGADDFLSKPVSRTTLLEAVERAFVQYRGRETEHERVVGLRAKLSLLTPREREVFSLVVRGKMNKEIAFRLGTSERTVKAHRHGMMEKLKFNSVAAAVSMAERLGLLAEHEDKDN